MSEHCTSKKSHITQIAWYWSSALNWDKIKNAQTQTITLTKKGKISNRKCCMDIHLCRLRSTISPYSSSISLKICPENKGGYTGTWYIGLSTMPDIAVKDGARAATAHNRSILFFWSRVGWVLVRLLLCVPRFIFISFSFKFPTKGMAACINIGVRHYALPRDASP